MPAYKALGVVDNIRGARYLVGDKGKEVEDFPLERGQNTIVVWDSIEDIGMVGYIQGVVGTEHTLSIQVVSNEYELTEFADLGVPKNYRQVLKFFEG